MMRNAPRPRIDIQTLIKLYGLGGPAEFGIGIAPVERPVTSAGPIVVLENLDLVTRFAQLIGSTHPGHARTEDQYARAFGIVREIGRSRITGLTGMSELGHDPVHDGSAGEGTDHP